VTDDQRFYYGYFVKDHLGKVRMVLTEEQKQGTDPAATLEVYTSAHLQKYMRICTEEKLLPHPLLVYLEKYEISPN
jgi:hypothetical protein